MHRVHAKYLGAANEDQALIARHAALLDRAARRLARRTGGAVSPDDLWSAGAMGLLEAARRFDPAQEVRFETFAEHRIRGAMLDELRRLDHLPRRMRAETERIEKTRARLGHELQREPSVEELAAAVGLEHEDVASLLGLAQPHVAMLDELTSHAPGGDELVARAELARAVTAAIARLPERLQLVLSLHYVEGLTYREIAKVLDVSEPRVCQLHSESMARLRALLGTADEPGARQR